MYQTIEESPAWYGAATMAERAAALRAHGRTRRPAEGVDPQRVARRLERWRSQPPFAEGRLFAQRLATDEIGEDDLLLLLGETPEAVRARAAAPPDWLRRFGEAFSAARARADAPPRGPDASGFLLAVDPLIRHALERLARGAEELRAQGGEVPFDPATVVGLFANSMLNRTLVMLSRTMILELNVARMQGLLEGESPEARFQSFLERLRRREHALALLEEYPVLARQITVRTENWLNASLEFLRRLAADWEQIRATFGVGDEVGKLVEVGGAAGDQHRGGRSVLVAKFSSGFQLVYKPRSLAVDVHLQELLGWLNERGDHLPFRTLKVIDRGEYGWVEFVTAEACREPAEVERFYLRQGGYLALLYAMQATDFHFENLIAAGEHPVLIDLESLFHPRLGDSGARESERLAGESLSHSVLRVGLLPQRFWVGPEGDGVDLSGLGAAGGQLAPQHVPYMEQTGTDEMRVARKRVEMPTGQNRPTLNGEEINLLDHADSVVAGFDAVYRTLLEHRDELLADGGPLARFSDDEVRVLLRPTKTYGQLLHESYHPDLLHDGLDRARLFDRLWISAEHQPHLARVIAAESQDLERGDIPLFTTRPASRHLWTSTGETVGDFFEETGLSLVRRLVRGMDEDDLARQSWFIRASFTSLMPGPVDAHWTGHELTESRASADGEQFLKAARAVGDRLEQLALGGADDAAWVGLTLVNQRHWSLAPLGPDLYGGLSGVALFLAHLGAVAREPRYTDLARRALAAVRRQHERTKTMPVPVGGFSGLGGTIYTLTHLGALWARPELIAEAVEHAERVAELVGSDREYDVISGAAGALAALCGLHSYAPSPRVLSAAVRCGEHLLSGARQMEPGVGWPTRLAPDRPLTGFSHGAAGIASSLLRLDALTGDGRFRAAALAAIDYERTTFSHEAGNWPDLRNLPTADGADGGGGARQAFVAAWCHGAPGVGLGRLHTLDQLDDARVRSEIRIAAATTLAQGFGQNHSLCHGDLGNLEFVTRAAEALGDERLRERARGLSAAVLGSIERQGWLCGVPSGVETPGLLTGLAGIGYGLLRLAEPARVPSVLVLAAPPR